MYFWNVDALADDLKNNRVSEHDKMRYLLGNGFITTLVVGINQLKNIILHIQISTPELDVLISQIRKFFKVPVKHRGVLYLRLIQENLEFWLIKAGLIALLFVVVYWGIRKCYRVNKAGDNKDFITRVICLSFPILFHMGALAAFLVGALIYWLPDVLAFLQAAHAIQLILEELLPLAFASLVLILMYNAIAKRLKYVSGQ